MIKFPEHVNGIDIETKAATNDAFIISIGMVTYRTRDLKMEASLNLCIDPECPIQTQLGREVTEATMDWWLPTNPNKWSPSKEARDWSWGGKMHTDQAISLVGKYLRECKKDPTMVHTMRGPDFDYVVLRSLYDQMGEYFDIKFSMLDSHRTTERALAILGVPPYNESEDGHISLSDGHIPHVAVCDASKEAYETAKYYHLLWWIRNHGYDRAMEVANNWQNGIYEAIPNE